MAWKPTAKESANMEFRWVAAIALWTILSGPIFNGRGTLSTPNREKVSANVVKPTPAPKTSEPKPRDGTASRFTLRAR
jgi:hypothetical protein